MLTRRSLFSALAGVFAGGAAAQSAQPPVYSADAAARLYTDVVDVMSRPFPEEFIVEP
jgi:hypothetical protein